MESGRANRSDVHLSAEEEERLEAKTRDYFDGIAPKRHTKPQRSEQSTNYVDAFSNANNTDNGTPEFQKFQRLEKEDPQSQKLDYSGSDEVEEEFVETEYYKDLNGVGKQHHTTGRGFIKVENEGNGGFHIEADRGSECHHSSASNPATNDWIPADTNGVNFESDKPNRSES